MSDETTLRDLDEAVERIDELEERIRWLEHVVATTTDYTPGIEEGDGDVESVKDVLAWLEDKREAPVPIKDVVHLASDRLDVSAGTVRAEIKQLRRRGEIYDAGDEAVRVT